MTRAVVLSISVFASVASAQWVEGRITLPDSLGGVGKCLCIAYSAAFNTVYVGSEASDSGGTVHAVDLTTNRVVARLRFSSVPQDLCLDEDNGKLYCAPGGVWPAGDSMLSVIDCATNGVVAEIPVGSQPSSLALDPASGKLYCSVRCTESPDSVVRVVCTSGDTVLGSLRLGHVPGALYLDTATSKLYCGSFSDERMTVVDATSDTLLAVLAVGRRPSSFCSASEVGKVYCCASGAVWAIDCYSDSVVGRAIVTRVTDICYNPEVRRVYAVGNRHEAVVIDAETDSIIKKFDIHRSGETPDKLVVAFPSLSRVVILFFDSDDITGTASVVDCAVDTVIAKVRIGSKPTAAVGIDSLGLALSISESRSLSIVDVAKQSLTGVVYLGAWVNRLSYSASADRLYVLHSGTLGAVHVIEAETNRPLASIRTGHSPRQICPADSWAKLYCVNSMERSLSVVDMAGDSTLTKLVVQPGPSFLALEKTLGKLYVGSDCWPMVAVVSCEGDSVQGTIDVGEAQEGLLVADDVAKLYVLAGPNRNVLAVVDIRYDSIVGEIPIAGVMGGAMQYSAASRRVYVRSGNRTIHVIDAGGDSLLNTIEVPGIGRGQLAWVPWTDEILVSDEGANYVQVIDCAQGVVTDRIDMYGYTTGMYPVVSSQRVYCASPEGVKVINVTGRRLLREFPSVEADFFAECPAHGRVFAGGGGVSYITVFRDSLVPAVEGDLSRENTWASAPTVVRGELRLAAPVGSFGRTGRRAVFLLNVAGQRVMDLRCGANDISRLSPGIYFITGSSFTAGKVVVAR